MLIKILRENLRLPTRQLINMLKQKLEELMEADSNDIGKTAAASKFLQNWRIN